MSIWALVMIVVMNNGQVYATVNTANQPQFNNEQSCNEAGSAKMQQEQTKVGSDNGSVYFKCDEITAAEIKAATGESSGTSL